jgi:hypothetical protein
MEAYMTVELKMNNTGIYPTYLNLTSSGDAFRYSTTPSVEFVDLSFSSNTFLVIEQSIEQNGNDINKDRVLH